jgi:ubiquinone/menaquinone biosynthesis C-methylase UbiE
MLQIAQGQREESCRVPLVNGDASSLPFPAASFDSVVTTLFLSSAPDPDAAVEEVRRVLRPAGMFLVLDHGRSNLFLVRVMERLAGSAFRVWTGVDLMRDPAESLSRHHFVIHRLRRSRLGIITMVAASKAA